MSIRIILDTRELSLAEQFTRMGFHIETKQLDLGDIMICFEEKRDNVVVEYTLLIERKTFTDLASSFVDGRYKEQKSRYLRLPQGTVFYILENNDPSFNTLSRESYMGTYIHTAIRDKIPVFISSSIAETRDIIIKIADTVKEFKTLSTGVCQKVEETQIKKKKATTSRDVFKLQLTCFSGISSNKAELIMKQYSDISSLIDSLRNDSFSVRGIGPKLISVMREGLNIK